MVSWLRGMQKSKPLPSCECTEMPAPAYPGLPRLLPSVAIGVQRAPLAIGVWSPRGIVPSISRQRRGALGDGTLGDAGAWGASPLFSGDGVCCRLEAARLGQQERRPPAARRTRAYMSVLELVAKSRPELLGACIARQARGPGVESDGRIHPLPSRRRKHV